MDRKTRQKVHKGMEHLNSAIKHIDLIEKLLARLSKGKKEDSIF